MGNRVTIELTPLQARVLWDLVTEGSEAFTGHDRDDPKSAKWHRACEAVLNKAAAAYRATDQRVKEKAQ